VTTRPVHEGLFELRADGTIALVGGYSATSGKYHFPLLDTCPYSGARDVERVVLTREGTLWAWTAVTAAPPGYTGRVPYGFGIVELTAERLRVVTRLTEPDPAQLSFGQPMRLVVEELADGVVTWAFA
jgi:uncharacterized OB-fold protein